MAKKNKRRNTVKGTILFQEYLQGLPGVKKLTIDVLCSELHYKDFVNKNMRSHDNPAFLKKKNSVQAGIMQTLMSSGHVEGMQSLHLVADEVEDINLRGEICLVNAGHMNGGTRLAAISELNDRGIEMSWSVRCEVYIGLSDADLATICKRLNTSAKVDDYVVSNFTGDFDSIKRFLSEDSLIKVAWKGFEAADVDKMEVVRAILLLASKSPETAKKYNNSMQEVLKAWKRMTSHEQGNLRINKTLALFNDVVDILDDIENIVIFETTKTPGKKTRKPKHKTRRVALMCCLKYNLVETTIGKLEWKNPIWDVGVLDALGSRLAKVFDSFKRENQWVSNPYKELAFFQQVDALGKEFFA